MASKIVQLIEQLHTRTMDGKVRWEQTERKDVYQAAFPNYALRIATQGNVNNPDYVLTIYNEEGGIIEDVSDVDLQEDLDNSLETMRGIYEAARREAMGIEKALNDLLTYMQQDE